MRNILKKVTPHQLINIIKFSFGEGRYSYPYRKYTDKYNCIFIHIPKVAGTSVLSLLMGEHQIKRDHLDYRVYQEADKVTFENYYKFCFVRNPYDRLVSIYEYLKGGGNKSQDKYFENLFKNNYPTFEEFVLNYLDEDVIFSHVLFKPQYSYVYNYQDECMVDYVGKFENIELDFNNIAKKINLKGRLAKKNASKRKRYSEYYTNSDVISKVNKLYKKDFLLFEYDTLI